jgi:MoxR-like ATPases
LRKEFEAVFREIQKAIVGNEDVIEKLLVSLLSEGHVLLVGVPGLAKTLMVRAFSKTLDLTFSRIQLRRILCLRI